MNNTNETARELYIDLMLRCLINNIYEDVSQDPWTGSVYHPSLRENGLDWPSQAHTMIGMKRMINLRQIAEHVLQTNTPGDFIETGVWRGGACIFMRAILKAYGVKDRFVWVADSFEGLPKPNPDMYPDDADDVHHTFNALAVSLEEVKNNFKKYNLLDDNVKFLKGWFSDTLHKAPIEKLAILRLDGDMYESTTDGLRNLYDKLSIGGFVIVDDYGLNNCRKAVHDFRDKRGIHDTINNIDNMGVFWQKSR